MSVLLSLGAVAAGEIATGAGVGAGAGIFGSIRDINEDNNYTACYIAQSNKKTEVKLAAIEENKTKDLRILKNDILTTCNSINKKTDHMRKIINSNCFSRQQKIDLLDEYFAFLTEEKS